MLFTSYTALLSLFAVAFVGQTATPTPSREVVSGPSEIEGYVFTTIASNGNLFGSIYLDYPKKEHLNQFTAVNKDQSLVVSIFSPTPYATEATDISKPKPHLKLTLSCDRTLKCVLEKVGATAKKLADVTLRHEKLVHLRSTGFMRTEGKSHFVIPMPNEAVKRGELSTLLAMSIAEAVLTAPIGHLTTTFFQSQLFSGNVYLDRQKREFGYFSVHNINQQLTVRTWQHGSQDQSAAKSELTCDKTGTCKLDSGASLAANNLVLLDPEEKAGAFDTLVSMTLGTTEVARLESENLMKRGGVSDFFTRVSDATVEGHEEAKKHEILAFLACVIAKAVFKKHPTLQW